ncbi:hypothetical protein, partial [Microcoleus sp. C2C6]|uniref:hypothetical protein n=1 Tax=Microcoleus sp. C2C6 TaxID=3055325 RepID=UPI002FD53B72
MELSTQYTQLLPIAESGAAFMYGLVFPSMDWRKRQAVKIGADLPYWLENLLFAVPIFSTTRFELISCCAFKLYISSPDQKSSNPLPLSP